jgi:hypothetical protein
MKLFLISSHRPTGAVTVKEFLDPSQALRARLDYESHCEAERKLWS